MMEIPMEVIMIHSLVAVHSLTNSITDPGNSGDHRQDKDD
jgi:hypothetical protein